MHSWLLQTVLFFHGTLVLPTVVALENSIIFGTNQGYDVGGNSSICIVTTIGTPSSSTKPTPIWIPPPPDFETNAAASVQSKTSTASAPLTETEPVILGVQPPGHQLDQRLTLSGSVIELDKQINNGDVDLATANAALKNLNQALFRARDPQDCIPLDDGGDCGPFFTQEIAEVEVELLADCYNGTYIKLEALDLEYGYSVYRNRHYTFRISLKMDAQDLLAADDGKKIPSFAGLFIRFAMCDALQRGFCNPVVDSTTTRNLAVALISQRSLDSKTTLLTGVADPKLKTVFSQWGLPYTVQTDKDSTVVDIENLELQFKIPPETPRGIYRLVLHTMFIGLVEDQAGQWNYEGTKINLSVKRVDTATKGEVPVLNVQDSPEIVSLSKEVEIAIYVLIGIYGTFGLVVLARLYQFRNHVAIKLAQGPFLAALLVAALVGGCCTFTYFPTKDSNCILRGPLVMFPFSAVGALLVCRLWRVYVTLSGAMRLGRSTVHEKEKKPGSVMATLQTKISDWNLLEKSVSVLSFIAKLDIIPKTKRPNKSSAILRQTATNAESAQLAVFLLLPQALVLAIGNGLCTPELILEYDQSGNVGRYRCTRNSIWVEITSNSITAALFMLAVVLAWVGRDIPSVFNEKDAIFHTATIAALAILINVVIVGMLRSDFDPPDTEVFLRCTALIFIGVLVVLNIVLPKIRRAQKGEKIVVGTLLRAYGNDPTEQYGQMRTSEGSAGTAYLAGAPIRIHKDDPIPPSIETQIHHLHSLFRDVSEKCASGRALSESQWEQMKKDVARLKTYLDRVTLDFTEVAEGCSAEDLESADSCLTFVEETAKRSGTADGGSREENQSEFLGDLRTFEVKSTVDVSTTTSTEFSN